MKTITYILPQRKEKNNVNFVCMGRRCLKQIDLKQRVRLLQIVITV